MKRFLLCLTLAVGLALATGCCCGGNGPSWCNWCGGGGSEPAPATCPR